MIYSDSPKLDFNSTSYADYLDICSQVTALSDVVAYGDRGGFVSGEGQGQEVVIEVVSQNFFLAMGVRTLLGRAFSAQASQASAEGRSVVVSYNLWQKYFRGDPSLSGKTTLLDDKEFTVIGVTPREFSGLRHQGFTPDIWVTKEGWETMLPGEERADSARDYRWFDVAAHLRQGTKINEARAQLQTLAKRLALAYPSSNQGVNFVARPGSEVAHEGMGVGIYLLAMVGLVLLISCANVANLAFGANRAEAAGDCDAPSFGRWPAASARATHC